MWTAFLAMLVIVFLSFGAISADVSHMTYEKTKLQSVADASALAGASDLFNGLTATQAKNDALAVGSDNGFIPTVTINTTNSTASVTVTTTIHNLFAGIIGRPTSIISATALASGNNQVQAGIGPNVLFPLVANTAVFNNLKPGDSFTITTGLSNGNNNNAAFSNLSDPDRGSGCNNSQNGYGSLCGHKSGGQSCGGSKQPGWGFTGQCQQSHVNNCLNDCAVTACLGTRSGCQQGDTIGHCGNNNSGINNICSGSTLKNICKHHWIIPVCNGNPGQGSGSGNGNGNGNGNGSGNNNGNGSGNNSGNTTTTTTTTIINNFITINITNINFISGGTNAMQIKGVVATGYQIPLEGGGPNLNYPYFYYPFGIALVQ